MKNAILKINSVERKICIYNNEQCNYSFLMTSYNGHVTCYVADSIFQSDIHVEKPTPHGHLPIYTSHTRVYPRVIHTSPSRHYKPPTKRPITHTYNTAKSSSASSVENRITHYSLRVHTHVPLAENCTHGAFPPCRRRCRCLYMRYLHRGCGYPSDSMSLSLSLLPPR